ncbi:S-layer homology domain-containing protein [Cohnella sp. REN36]|uniref:S-layer homology domain-containing protein n=1 Tax=Cohnella sp. REN36 TaxID=2887347 RepID=UPI001D15B712|nr:S-layer homology domain-containing protein [Cohnella sp. REN36]MCC3374784.1 S-layer homology domain-containing protein [Cohnella sp. REN36]
MIANLSGDAPTGRGSASFSDAEAIPDWALAAAEKLQAKGWMLGRPDGSFAPLDTVTRAEAITVIVRWMQSRIEART